jgi:hypothetical protein
MRSVEGAWFKKYSVFPGTSSFSAPASKAPNPIIDETDDTKLLIENRLFIDSALRCPMQHKGVFPFRSATQAIPFNFLMA